MKFRWIPFAASQAEDISASLVCIKSPAISKKTSAKGGPTILLDLFLTNGYVSLDRKRNYWYDFSKVAGGNSTIIGDARDWPSMDGRSLSGYQQKHVWLNDGAGKFVDVAQSVGVTDVYDGRSVALADLWNRGVLDVIVANQRGPLLLYKNTVSQGNGWIEFELEGSRSNRSAIGSQVRLFWNGQQQLQEVSGGSGFCAQNQRRLHFGLGKTGGVERVEIRWPSGRVQTYLKPSRKLPRERTLRGLICS